MAWENMGRGWVPHSDEKRRCGNAAGRGLTIGEGNFRIVALESIAHLSCKVHSWMARVMKVGQVSK